LVIDLARGKDAQVEQIDFLYRTCLSRPPNKQDKSRCIEALAQELDISDIFWALLNSREFIFIQ